MELPLYHIDAFAGALFRGNPAAVCPLDRWLPQVETLKSARAVQEVAAWAPADRILVETDSPYLAPVPMRGKSCEPAYIVHTARRVAELRGVAVETLAELTTENAERRFRRRFSAEARGDPARPTQ